MCPRAGAKVPLPHCRCGTCSAAARASAAWPASVSSCAFISSSRASRSCAPSAGAGRRQRRSPASVNRGDGDSVWVGQALVCGKHHRRPPTRRGSGLPCERERAPGASSRAPGQMPAAPWCTRLSLATEDGGGGAQRKALFAHHHPSQTTASLAVASQNRGSRGCRLKPCALRRTLALSEVVRRALSCAASMHAASPSSCFVCKKPTGLSRLPAGVATKSGDEEAATEHCSQWRQRDSARDRRGVRVLNAPTIAAGSRVG